MFLRSYTHRRLRSRLFAAFLGVFALTWSPLPGLAQACIAWTSFGEQRNCTFTEELGKCYYEALDSRQQCLGGASSFWARSRCHFAFGIDHTACIIGSPIAIIVAKFK